MKGLSPLSYIFPQFGFHNHTLSEINGLPKTHRRHKNISNIVSFGAGKATSFEPTFRTIILGDKEVTVRLLIAEIPFKNAVIKNTSGSGDLNKLCQQCAKLGLTGFYRVKARYPRDKQDPTKPRVNENNLQVCYFDIEIFLDSGKFELDTNRYSPNLIQDSLCTRTETVGMEFIGGYRSVAAAIWRMMSNKQMYGHRVALTNHPNLPHSSKYDSWEHPTKSDIQRLLCSYGSIEKYLALTEKNLEGKGTTRPAPKSSEEWSAYQKGEQTFVNEYKRIWSEEHRVSWEIVCSKTVEYFLTAKVPAEYRKKLKCPSCGREG